ncbi:MAG TPA: VWA domain-containing protein [Pyrinomonadaceae bacterium]|nr:VWA domain-containing protein [Pyrinomonadaceae bacterium]
MMKRLHYARVQTASLYFFLCVALLLPVAGKSGIAQEPSAPAAQAAPERPPDESILLTVTVMDKKGNYVVGLNKSNFSLYSNKLQQEISSFNADDEPMSIGVLFDLSNSVTSWEHDNLMAAANAFLRFVKLSHSANEYFVVGFGTRPSLLLDWTRGDKVAEEVQSKLNKVIVKGGATALFDACYLGLEKVKSGSYRKQAILLISDGLDSISKYTFDDLRERFQETGIPLYSICVYRNLSGGILTREGQALLDTFSTISGGVAVFPDSKKKIDAAFEQIAIELRHQYRLGFKPSKDKADGKWHSLKVKLTLAPGSPPAQSDLSVRSRTGYKAARTLR